MNKQLLDTLEKEYKKLFENVWEFGGGYGFRLNHGMRVMNYCQKIAKYPRFRDENINTDALLIGALFHDIGKIKAIDENGQLIYGNYGDTNHNALGAKIAPEYLNKFIKDKELVDLTCLIISEQESKIPTRVESKIVKDADRLDHQGVIHLWCSITYANYQKKNIEGLKEFWEGEEGKKKYEANFSKFYFPEIRVIAEKRFKNLAQATELMFKEQEAMDL
jgi:putative nucleotidyltransferase with HDIG domain